MSTLPPGTRLRLLYFNFTGRAECLRLAMAYASIPFEDYFFSSNEEFLAMKDSGELRFGQIPALEVCHPTGEKTVLSQSLAMLRFIARIAPPQLELYPSDPVVGALVDGIAEQVSDAFMGISVAKFGQRFGFGMLEDEENTAIVTAALKANEIEVIPQHLASLNAHLIRGGTGWLAGTPQPTIADFMWAPWLKFTLDERKWCGEESHTLLAATPELVAWSERFYSLPAIMNHYACKVMSKALNDDLTRVVSEASLNDDLTRAMSEASTSTHQVCHQLDCNFEENMSGDDGDVSIEIEFQTEQGSQMCTVCVGDVVYDVVRRWVMLTLQVSDDAVLTVSHAGWSVSNADTFLDIQAETGARLSVTYEVLKMQFENVYDKVYIHSFGPDQPGDTVTIFRCEDGALRATYSTAGGTTENIDLPDASPGQIEWHEHNRLLYFPQTYCPGRSSGGRGFVLRLRECDVERVLWGLTYLTGCAPFMPPQFENVYDKEYMPGYPPDDPGDSVVIRKVRPGEWYERYVPAGGLAFLLFSHSWCWACA